MPNKLLFEGFVHLYNFNTVIPVYLHKSTGLCRTLATLY